MKRLIAISFLSIYLLSVTELIQLVKLPALIEHFSEHKESNRDLSLAEFLVMHYTLSDDHDGDRDKDMKLPFKSHDGCVNTTVVAFLSNDVCNIVSKPVYTENTTFSIYTEDFLSSSFLSSIWQPPKSC